MFVKLLDNYYINDVVRSRVCVFLVTFICHP